jgi:LysR family glycine cleavage system transcriptional activator
MSGTGRRMKKTDRTGLPAALEAAAGKGPLPPLNAIRAFVEAARQLSFSRAARSLGMTQGGVSHHVASLENFLGQRLFVRAGSSVALTDVGRLYFDTVQEALSTIELSTRQLAQRAAAAAGVPRLIVRTSMPTLAMAVLIPALPGFAPATPVAVDVVTSLSPPSAADAYDVLVTRDLEIAGAEHWLIATETLVCVAAPPLHREWGALPRDRWPFLAARSRPDALAAWLARQGLQGKPIRVAAGFDHYFLAIQAALGGMGFLVAPRLLVRQALRQGQLMEVLDAAVRGTAEYKAYVNPQTPVPEAAAAFCRWLKAQLKSEDGAPDGVPLVKTAAP